MTAPSNGQGLDANARRQLLDRLSKHTPVVDKAPDEPFPRSTLGDPNVLKETELVRAAGAALGLANPYFRQFDGLGGPVADIAGRRMSNFASYDYLGLNGHPRVSAAAQAAIVRHGTSVSGSRIMSGERPIHRQLEAALAEVYQADDAVVMVSGHAANVTVIGHLVGPDDLVVHDSLAHNSIVQGAILSRARRRVFPHNDLDALESILHDKGARAGRVLVVAEGYYSMDGDAPDLPRLSTMCRRHGAHLMVDEAHALGVLGSRGLGVAEHFGLDPGCVDLWMGTLSKTLASCGGYVAGNATLIDYLRNTAPGFLYSVGMPAPVAAAALAALEIMREEPERTDRLRANGQVFLQAARDEGLDTGDAMGVGIIPIILGSSLKTILTAEALWTAGVNVQPIHYPGVPERTARLRFFVTAAHDPNELRRVARLTAQTIRETVVDPALLADIATRLGQ